MNLVPGTRLGPYEVVEPLGAGGMGEVYRARDTRLGRVVALKVLPAAFAADPDRLARFEREAKTLAALNHPHIAQIYGLEHSSNAFALVMELVEGDDLAARIARAPIAIDEALPIARQIAEGLEAAHEAGIIHRDLKVSICIANARTRRALRNFCWPTIDRRCRGAFRATGGSSCRRTAATCRDGAATAINCFSTTVGR
jgi:serine/threonine protein kinase